MSYDFLKFADYFFLVFHTLLICFNLFAWIWTPLRKWHLATITLTLASWVILGFWYGWGYCPLTDWHWEVLRKLGENELPNSYISYLLSRVFGIDLSAAKVDLFTLIFALLAFLISIRVNFFTGRK
jgi:hypothetical protein